MNKAFIKETDTEDELPEPESLPPGTRNYITVNGYQRLRNELAHLVKVERPELVQVVAWAASNGDRSENGDYLYGKKRLREIDRRIRYLTKRIENSVVVDPCDQENTEVVFFGATVTVSDTEGIEATYQIVGVDEADASAGQISWLSPLARALIKTREGDQISFLSPSGKRDLDVLTIRYI